MGNREREALENRKQSRPRRVWAGLPCVLAMLVTIVSLSACSFFGGTGDGMGGEAPAAEAPAAVEESVPELVLIEEEPGEPEAKTPETETPEAGILGSEADGPEEAPSIGRDGTYTAAEDVALYLHTYGELPSNFITKAEARKLGWEGGSLEPYAPGMCIGGDYFGNYEGLLPEKDGREYHECDIGTLGQKSRGAKRIIYSDDGLIYYTEDHYESFTLLYGEELLE